jgi:hypothetical protein
MFMETSAKAGHNVKTLFKKIAMSLPGMEKDGNTDAANSAFLYYFSRGGQITHTLVTSIQRSMLLLNQLRSQRLHLVSAEPSAHKGWS